MAFADTAKLVVDLSLKGNFGAQIKANQKALSGLDKAVIGTQGRAYKAGTQIGTGIKRGALIAAGALGFLALNVEKGLASLSKLDDVVAQTNAVLKSTKGAAGENAAAIRDLANKYEGLNATIDDTVIQSGENLLLTFTNIRKQAFEPALAAALDMNQALGRGEEGLSGTVRSLGRALNDPKKGLVQLTRLGITFTDEQKKQIDVALKAGDTFKAQGIILTELQKRFGGSFLAGGQTTTGKVAKFKDAIDDLQRVLATALLPVIGKVADALTKFLADPKVIKGVDDLGKGIASLFSDKNLAIGADFLQGAFATAKEAAPIVASAAKTTLGFVQAAVGLFKTLPPELQGLLVGAFAVNKLTGGLVTNIAGGIIDTVGKQFLQRGGTPANPLFVADVTGGLGKAGGVAGGVAGKAGGLLGTVGKVLGVVGLAEIANELSPAAQQLGRDIGKALPLADIRTSIGNGLTDWIKNAPWPFGTKGQPDWAGGDPNGTKLAPTLLDRGGRQGGTAGPGDRLKDDVTSLAQLQKSAQLFINQSVRSLLTALAKPGQKPGDVLDEVKRSVALFVDKGRGSAGSTASLIKELRSQLAHTHDPQLQSAIRSAIGKLEAKLPGREFRDKLYSKADKIVHSGATTATKIQQLQAIEKDLKDHKLPKAGEEIRKRIDLLKRDQVYAARATTEAIKDKDLSTNITIPVTNKVTVNSREIVSAQATFHNYFVTGDHNR